MGPRLLSRGNDVAAGVNAADDRASMGPRLLSRGNARIISHGPIKFSMLQWGHGC